MKTYNPLYIDDMGTTDGETCERAWAYLKGFGNVIKEMKTSSRNEVLEDALFYLAKRS